jgi:hypothetical protein
MGQEAVSALADDQFDRRNATLKILSIMFCTFAGVLTQRTASGLTHRGW